MPPNDDIRLIRIDESVVMVQLSRPPHNFISHELVSAVADAYEELAGSTDTRVIVLASEGKNFCAGADFSGAGGRAGDVALPADAVYRTYSEGASLLSAPLPVVAAIRGAAVGGGLGLACTADFRVGGPSTRLVPNFSRLGVHHGFGLTVTLPQIVGFQRANELLYVGRRITGEEGFRIGLLDRFVDDELVEDAAIAFAREIATSAPLAVRAIRETMRAGLAERFRAAAERESQQQARLGSTSDFREGVLATAVRRPPKFTGR